jgi:hypothetical protein
VRRNFRFARLAPPALDIRGAVPPSPGQAGKGRGRSCGGPGCPGRLLQRLEGAVERAVEFGLLGDGLRQFGLHGGALAAREAAAPQLCLLS